MKTVTGDLSESQNEEVFRFVQHLIKENKKVIMLHQLNGQKFNGYSLVSFQNLWIDLFIHQDHILTKLLDMEVAPDQTEAYYDYFPLLFNHFYKPDKMNAHHKEQTERLIINKELVLTVAKANSLINHSIKSNSCLETVRGIRLLVDVWKKRLLGSTDVNFESVLLSCARHLERIKRFKLAMMAYQKISFVFKVEECAA